MTVEINQIEHKITINTSEGTAEVVGHLAVVNEFQVSICLKQNDSNQHATLFVSDVKTGTLITRVGINVLEFWQADTKEEAMELFSEKLKLVEGFMSTKVIQEIKEKRSAYPKVRAPQPIEDYDKFAKSVMEGATE